MDFIKFWKRSEGELSSSMPYFLLPMFPNGDSLSSSLSWVWNIFFIIIFMSLLLSENRLDWGCLALLLASLVHHAHGFEQFHCFEIFGAFKKSMDESVWVVVHWKFNLWHVHSGTLYNCLLHFEQRCLHYVFSEA